MNDHIQGEGLGGFMMLAEGLLKGPKGPKQDAIMYEQLVMTPDGGVFIVNGLQSRLAELVDH